MHAGTPTPTFRTRSYNKSAAPTDRGLVHSTRQDKPTPPEIYETAHLHLSTTKSMDSFQVNSLPERERPYSACHDGKRSVKQVDFPAVSDCLGMGESIRRGECGLPATGWRSDGARLCDGDDEQQQQQQQQKQLSREGDVDNSVQNGSVSEDSPQDTDNRSIVNNSIVRGNSLVRVGEKVSFSTIVEAVLIPSISDIDAQAKHDIWWQAPDYMEFRRNYVRFIRTPSIEDDPDWKAVPTADPVASPTSVSAVPPSGVPVGIPPLTSGGSPTVQDAVLVVASAAVSPAPSTHSIAHEKMQQPRQQMKQRKTGNQYKHAGLYNRRHENAYRGGGVGGGCGYDDGRKRVAVYNYASQNGGIDVNYRQHVNNQAVRSPPFNGQPGPYQQRECLDKLYASPHHHQSAACGGAHGNLMGVHNASAGHHGHIPAGNMNHPYAIVDYSRGVPSGVPQDVPVVPAPLTVHDHARRAHGQRVQQQQQHQYHKQSQGGGGVAMPGFSLWRGPVMYAPAAVYHHHQPAPIGLMRQ